MDISCPAKHAASEPWKLLERSQLVLIFGSYFSVSCRQASRPSLSPAKNTMLSRSRASSSRVESTPRDRFLPGSWRLGSALQPSQRHPQLLQTWYRCATIHTKHSGPLGEGRALITKTAKMFTEAKFERLRQNPAQLTAACRSTDTLLQAPNQPRLLSTSNISCHSISNAKWQLRAPSLAGSERFCHQIHAIQ